MRAKDSLVRFTYTEYHMGVDARIIVFAKDQNQAETACAAAFERMAQLDSMMSDYRKESELMLLCGQAGGPAQHVSDDLFRVLTRACEVSRRTGGAFDISVGPLIQIWRKARKSGVLPAASVIREARQLVGWRKIQLHPRDHSVRLAQAGMRLDLGGIAKGYGCDEAQAVLRKNGISSALVQMGGDIVVTDPPPGAKGWTIEVPNAAGAPEIAFANLAISTSGDTEQFAVIGGVRYSHVVNPKTGWAETNRVQATLVARDGLTSDPLSTAVTLLSSAERARLLRSYPGTREFIRVEKRGE